jgi:hypothetical protein
MRNVIFEINITLDGCCDSPLSWKGAKTLMDGELVALDDAGRPAFNQPTPITKGEACYNWVPVFLCQRKDLMAGCRTIIVIQLAHQSRCNLDSILNLP